MYVQEYGIGSQQNEVCNDSNGGFTPATFLLTT